MREIGKNWGEKFKLLAQDKVETSSLPQVPYLQLAILTTRKHHHSPLQGCYKPEGLAMDS